MHEFWNELVRCVRSVGRGTGLWLVRRRSPVLRLIVPRRPLAEFAIVLRTRGHVAECLVREVYPRHEPRCDATRMLIRMVLASEFSQSGSPARSLAMR